LGKDFSGNGNYWTTNNISITAGVTYDSMTDVPTLTSATAANFAVLNPVNKATVMPAPTNGNLYITGTSGGYWNAGLQSSIGVSSGKWYWEVSAIALSITNGYFVFGIASNYFQPTTITSNDISYLPGVASNTGGYWRPQSSTTYFNGTTGSFSGSFVVGDVCNIAFDADTGKIWYGKNGTWLNSGSPSTGANPAFTVTTGNAPYYPWVGVYATTDTWAINFGQQAFGYTPPTGFVSLNTFNLPTSTIVKGSDNMSIALAAGASIKTTTEALFTGQFLEWIKDRANANNHQLLNGVTGLSAVLQSNTTAAETTYSAPSGSSVGWAWKAGSSAVSNTNGTITSTVSVNASAGFSVVTYTGNGTNPGATIGHGLGVAPAMIICKNRSNVDWWPSYHVSAGITNTLYLNDTVGSSTYLNRFSAVSSTTFTTGVSGSELNTSANNYVAYCWTPIAGYSAFGSYTGNGSADGAFIYTGIRAKFVLIKRIDTANDWVIHDTARDTYNLADLVLYPNGNYTESSGASGRPIDILSNGFKCRSTEIAINASGGTYIYATFAETPLKYSLGR
jgi:hypothetical protein